VGRDVLDDRTVAAQASKTPPSASVGRPQTVEPEGTKGGSIYVVLGNAALRVPICLGEIRNDPK
jgi:hypothetical protein